MVDLKIIKDFDPELYRSFELELARQLGNLELIASENIVSPAVMAAMGTVLTNKYAEGYPAHRYYGGCAYVDQVEQIAINRACELFGAKFANVQPHSGAQANLAVYFALLEVGDTIEYLCEAYDYQLNPAGSFIWGEKTAFDGELTVSYEDIGLGECLVYYCLTDIYGNQVWTEPVIFTD